MSGARRARASRRAALALQASRAQRGQTVPACHRPTPRAPWCWSPGAPKCKEPQCLAVVAESFAALECEGAGDDIRLRRLPTTRYQRRLHLLHLLDDVERFLQLRRRLETVRSRFAFVTEYVIVHLRLLFTGPCPCRVLLHRSPRWTQRWLRLALYAQ